MWWKDLLLMQGLDAMLQMACHLALSDKVHEMVEACPATALNLLLDSWPLCA